MSCHKKFVPRTGGRPSLHKRDHDEERVEYIRYGGVVAPEAVPTFGFLLLCAR